MPAQLLRTALTLALVATLLLSSLPLAAAENTGPDAARGKLEDLERLTTPVVDPASDEALKAIDRMNLPPGFAAHLFAAEPMFANPVAFNLDELGRVFVSETHRYGSSTLDIRGYMWMLEDDLANRNQADWLASIARNFGPDGVLDLSKESEIIRLLEDTDGDGTADKSSIYADDFRTPLDGVASGVLPYRGNVWFTNIPALWKLTGRDRAESRGLLHRGYGVRFNYTGHDLHGLILAPDGRIYFSIGDRGAHVPTKEGGIVDMPDTGAVFRCWPDGTGLELFASGLRNPQSLAFNEYGDLFTGDNDSDQGDEERMVHVVEGGDSGWRVGYQFAPRGNAGPWNTEKLWHPRHAGQPAYLLAPLFNIEDGPSGIAYYPGTGLTPAYAGHLFITHFKGSVSNSGIFSYKMKQAGATYAIDTAAPFLTGALPTDVRFGPDGKLYYSDWAEGWPKSRRGRIYSISDPKFASSPEVKAVQVLIASDFAKKSDEELAGLLSHADWRVRLEAQYSLAERGAASIGQFTAAANGASDLARRHAVWGLGQIARKNDSALAALRPLLAHADSEIRAQAAKTLGDLRDSASAETLVPMLADESARVRFYAAEALGKLKHAAGVPALLAAVRANNDADDYLRHAYSVALSRCATSEQLAALASDGSASVRLAAVLALRRQKSPMIAAFLADTDASIVRETAIAINDAPIPDAYDSLAAHLGKSTDESVELRALNAHFRLGSTDNAAALANTAGGAALARLGSNQRGGTGVTEGTEIRSEDTERLSGLRELFPDSVTSVSKNSETQSPQKESTQTNNTSRNSDIVRKEALDLLAFWPEPPARDRIVGVYRPLAEATRPAEIAARALAPVLLSILVAGTPDEVQLAALDAVEVLDIKDSALLLATVVADKAQSTGVRVAALETLDKLDVPGLADIAALAAASEVPELRIAAVPISSRLDPKAAVAHLAALVDDGTALEQQTAFRALGDLQEPRADDLLLAQLGRLAANEVAPAAQLDLLDAAALREDPRIKEALAARDAALAKDPDPLAPFRVSLEGGDAERAFHIIYRDPVMQCIRCHKVGDEGSSDVGPDLAGIGSRVSREYLLESIIKPSAKIAPGYELVVVTKANDEAVVGTLLKRDDSGVRVKSGDGEEFAIPAVDVKSVESAPSAMPEIAAIALTKAQIRDLIAGLAALTEEAESQDEKPTLRALRGMHGAH